MKNLFRLVEINLLLARYGLDEILAPVPMLGGLRWLGYINPFNWFRN